MTALRPYARLALAIVLLAGWQAALVHPIEHVDEVGAFVHPHGGHSHGEDSGAGPLCDLLAALTACAPGAKRAFAASGPLEHHLPSHHDDAPRGAQPPPFLAQGPPASV
jgi:hypothetical protein